MKMRLTRSRTLHLGSVGLPSCGKNNEETLKLERREETYKLAWTQVILEAKLDEPTCCKSG